jgi:hypothetical protein
LDVDPVVTIKSKTNLFGMVPYLPKIWKTAYDQTAIDRKKNSWRTEPRLIWNLGGEAGTRHGGTRRHKLSGRDFSQLRLRSRDQKLLEHDLFHRVRNIHPPPTNGFAVALRPMPTSQISAELVKHRSAIPLSPSGVTDRNSADGSVVRMSTASDVHLPGAVEADNKPRARASAPSDCDRRKNRWNKGPPKQTESFRFIAVTITPTMSQSSFSSNRTVPTWREGGAPASDGGRFGLQVFAKTKSLESRSSSRDQGSGTPRIIRSDPAANRRESPFRNHKKQEMAFELGHDHVGTPGSNVGLDAATAASKSASVAGELWLDTLSLRDWLLSYLSDEIARTDYAHNRILSEFAGAQ